MRPVWKWIIGIVVVLVVLAVVAGGVWIMAGRFAAMRNFVQNQPQVVPAPNVPNNPNNPNTPQGPYYGQRGQRGPYMMPYGGRGYPMMPMMGGRRGGFGLFGIVGGLIGFLFFIGFLTALVLGIIWLVRSLSRRPMGAVGAASTTVPPAAQAAETHACANCGYTVQNGYEFCPNCGTKQ